MEQDKFALFGMIKIVSLQKHTTSSVEKDPEFPLF